MNELINAVNATKFPSRSAKNSHMLKEINIKVETGDFVAITGPVEAEKTALLRLLCLRDKELGMEKVEDTKAGDLPMMM
jgi:ABC-type iron transport system FetAB ATPase subunit